MTGCPPGMTPQYSASPIHQTNNKENKNMLRHGAHLSYTRYDTVFVWVPIMEKAFAKAHGSYKSIESGSLDEAMRILTGAPTFTIEIKDKS